MHTYPGIPSIGELIAEVKIFPVNMISEIGNDRHTFVVIEVAKKLSND